MRTIIYPIVTVALGFIFIFGSMTAINAQEAADDEFTLEEITVTAQKREENQQKVAITMETFSGEELKELGYNNLDDILSRVSSAIVNTAQDGMRVSLRGMADTVVPMGALNDMSISTPTVAVNVDGVYSSRRNNGSGLYDMERVEVLYGPQGTLYATSSPGGIVNIVTANPKVEKFEASGTLEYGDYNAWKTQGAINVPVNERMAMRMAFSTSFRDGYLSNGSDDEDNKSARFKALFKPNDILSLVLTGETTNRGGHGYSGTDAFVDEGDVNDPWDNSDQDVQPNRSNTQEKGTGHLNWDFGFGTLTLIPSYSVEDEFATQTRENREGEAVSSTIDREGTEKGAELRIASSADSAIKWIIGANHYKADTNEMNLPETGYYEYRTVEQSTDAFYGNITYPTSDRFRITAGARLSDDETYVSEEMYKSGEETGKDEDWLLTQSYSIKYNEPDFKIGVEYDINDNSMFYADWSTTYRAVGYVIKQMDPERLNSVTIGSKNRFLDNRIQINTAAYYYDYQDYVADFGRVADPESFYATDKGTVTNGALKMYGADLQASTIITNQDRLDFSISYLSSEFDELVFDFVNPKFPDQDYSGKPNTFSPEWTLTAAYNHNFNLPNGGVLTGRVDTRFQSEYLVNFSDLYQDAGFDSPDEDYYIFYSQVDYVTQEAHHVSNLSLIYAHPGGNWTFTGYIQNLENYAVKTNIMKGSMMIGSPRTYGAIFSARF